MEKIWQLPKEKKPVLQALLEARGIIDEKQKKTFFEASFFSQDYLEQFNPFLFSDMEVAVQMVIEKIKNKEKIVVFGDYDADGVTASAVMLQALNLLKAETDIYIPDRVKEGYGLNIEAIKKIFSEGAKLVITVDCGIRSAKEVEVAKELGLEVIITDHHTLPPEEASLPNCPVLDSADPQGNYPDKNLAGVGVAFKLVQALLLRSKLDEKTRLNFMIQLLDLVALGTIADMVPLLGENRLLVKAGLEIMAKQKRLGIKELASVAKISPPFTSFNIGFQLAPRLNAASRLDHANTALALLLTTNPQEARELAQDLNEKNKKRQKQTELVLQAAEKQIKEKLESWIFVCLAEIDSSSWNEGVIGLAAGRLAEKYNKPVLVISRTSEGFKSSGRSIPSFNLVKALEECAELLDRYGGHPMAGGFSIFKEENLEKFTKKIKEIAKRELEGQDLRPRINLEAYLNSQEIDMDLLQEIEDLGPFGQKNPQPKLVALKERIYDLSYLSDGQHLKIRLAKGISALLFNAKEKYPWLEIGKEIDLAYNLERNGWNGKSEPQLKIIDLRLSE